MNATTVQQSTAVPMLSQSGPTAPTQQPAVSNTTTDPKDFSPFKTLNFQPPSLQSYGWNAFGDKSMVGGPSGVANPKGFSTAPGSAVMTSMAQQSDMSKAPGYRPPSSQGQAAARHGSPNITSETNWSTGINAPAVSGAALGGQPFRAVSSSAANIIGSGIITTSTGNVDHLSGGMNHVQVSSAQLYPAQERCNSAPGTPVSPAASGHGQVPSPIGPPSSVIATSVHQQQHGHQSVSGGGSPSSDHSGWFRPAPGSGLVSSAAGIGPPPNLRSLTPDVELDRRWALDDDLPAPRRQGSGSYGHNSPAKAPGAPLQNPFGTGSVLSDLMGANNQMSNMPFDNNHLLAAVSSSNNLAGIGVSMAPGIAMPDMSSAFSRPVGHHPMMSRFTAPPLTSSTAPTYSQGLHMPDSLGMAPKAPGLNPNAPDFNQSGLYGPAQGLRNTGLPPRLGQMMNGPQKMNSGFPGYGGGPYDGGLNNFQSILQNQSSILQNQSINAYLSQLGGFAGPTANHNLDLSVPTGGFPSDLLSGKTLSELMDMPESRYMSNHSDALSDHHKQAQFRQPIGAERRGAAPSPIGMPPGSLMGNNLNRKMPGDPFAVWDMPPSYNAADNLHTSAAAVADSFTRLIPSLSGQTISSLDNLVAASASGGLGNFNSGPGPVMVDASGLGPVSGIGMTGKLFFFYKELKIFQNGFKTD